MPITAEEQLLLELINEARLDPVANAERYIYSYNSLLSLQPDINAAFKFFQVGGPQLQDAFRALTPVGPLAWNDSLASAAESHSAAMIAADQQSHQVDGEAALAARVQAAGYTGTRVLGENVYAYSSSILYGHAGLMVDWGEGTDGIQKGAGHRANIMSANYTEVGLDITTEKNPDTTVGPYVITQDFGSRGKFFVTGVAYSDNDLNDFYSIGEGKAGLTVALGGTSATTTAVGGYSLAATTLGSNTITLSGGGLSGTVTVTSSILDSNLKLDVVDGRTLLTSGSISVSGPVSIIRALGLKGVSITAASGTQKIEGNDGDDTLDGGGGDDLLYGGEGADKLIGGDGNDFLKGEGGRDVIDGGAGIDVAVFHDPMAKYIIRVGTGGTLTISGDRDGTDIVSNVEYYRFGDGQYRWDNSKMVLVANNAPSLPATQTLGTGVGVAKMFTVVGTDPDGDVLSYSAGRTANGTITSQGNGVFLYTPKATFTGTDTFTMTASDGRGGTATQSVSITVAKANDAPTVAATQNLFTAVSAAKQFTVSGSDINGDALTYTATNPAHGKVTGGANGVFTYTPTSGYLGTDTLSVTVSDGKGGTASQTVSFNITQPNDPPTVAATQSIATNQGAAKQFTVSGSDVNGDTLTYSAANPAHGKVTGGSNGVFTYTPTSGYSGADSILVTVNDGKGGTATQTVNVQVAFVVPPASGGTSAPFIVYMGEGQKTAVGGTGTVMGTNGFQDVTLLDNNDKVTFDGSFNRGGDIIRLPGQANEYAVLLNGSSVELRSNDSTYLIPLGTVGMTVVFADGVRKLVFDGTNPKIGSQTIDAVAKQVTAPADSTPLPSGAQPDAHGLVFLSAGADFAVKGDNNLFGTTGNEKIRYEGGDLVLDPSFNRGGDTLFLSDPVSSFKGYLSGSMLILLTPDGEISIPVGEVGMTLNFAGQALTLKYNTSTQKVMLGDNVITSTNANDPDDFGGGLSLDVGSPTTAVSINLTDGTNYVLTESSNVTSNVLVHGFDLGDFIKVTGQPLSEYSFSNGDADKNGVYGDLVISYNTDGISNSIALLNAVSTTAFVFSLSSAEAAIGGQFITTGSVPNQNPNPNPNPNPSGDEVSLDVGSATFTVLVNLDDGADYVLTESAGQTSNVNVHGFDLGDFIEVTGAALSEYNFSNGDADKDGSTGDLIIQFSTNGVSNSIALLDAVAPSAFITGLGSAEQAIGGQFITLG